jgi:hypothetical protein
MPLRWPFSTTLFLANWKISPSTVRPWMNSSPLPSSHSTRPPRGLTVMLSGAFSTAALGDWKTSVIVRSFGSLTQICPWPMPPLVETM